MSSDIVPVKAVGQSRDSNRPGVLTKELLLTWIPGLLVASIGISSVIGWIGSSGAFDWNLAAVAGTAFGTIMLAGFTGALAWTTSGDVRATWDLAELTRQEAASRIQPSVLIIGRNYSGGPQFGVLSLTLVNAGLGAAVHISIDATYTGEGDVGPTSARKLSYIRPGGSIDQFQLTVRQGQAPGGGVQAQSFTLVGTCEDVTQDQRYPVIDLTT